MNPPRTAERGALKSAANWPQHSIDLFSSPDRQRGAIPAYAVPHASTSINASLVVFCSSRRIRLLRQLTHDFKKLRRLADEESHCGQERERAHRSTARLGGTNDRTLRELSTQEGTRLGHDEGRREGLPTKRRRVEVWKRQSVRWIRKRSQRRRNRGARLVGPRLKVHGLGRSDADQDSQDYHIRRPLHK